MTFVKVLLAVVAVLWLVSLIRIGGRISYGRGGLFVTALAGPLKIQILPGKPGKGAKKKKTVKKEEPPGEKKPAPESRPDTLSRLMKLLPVVGQACGALKRKIRIDDLELELIWGGGDPAAIALGYGQANAVLGMLWPVLDNNFKVRRHSFQIGMDYGADRPAVELRAAVTLSVGQAAALSARYGVKALAAWIKSGRGAEGQAHQGAKRKNRPDKKQEALSHE